MGKIPKQPFTYHYGEQEKFDGFVNELLDGQKESSTADTQQNDDIKKLQETAVAGANYDSSTTSIQLLNAAGQSVGNISASDFIKDGMISDVTLNGANLVMTFNTDAGKQPITVSLSSLTDTSAVIANIDALSGKIDSVSAKTDAADIQISGLTKTVSGFGLLIENQGNLIDAISGNVDTLSAKTDAVSGQVKTLSDDTNDRFTGVQINLDNLSKFFSDLEHTVEGVSTKTNTISGDVETVRSSVTTLTDDTNAKIGEANEKISVISGDVVSVNSGLTALSGAVIDHELVISTTFNKFKTAAGFDSNAQYVPNSADTLISGATSLNNADLVLAQAIEGISNSMTISGVTFNGSAAVDFTDIINAMIDAKIH
jgi:archaellum component FlaC